MYSRNEEEYVEIKGEPFIFTKNNFAMENVVPDDLPSMVDPAGYIDPNARIREMEKAGIRMDEWNRAVYDYDNPDDQDDDLTMDIDRWDDDNEMLRKGMNSLDRYRDDMARMYREYIKTSKEAENVVQEQSSPLLEPKKDEAVKS
jgi:hypothetical protein